MSRVMTWINLIGVLALAAIYVRQWSDTIRATRQVHAAQADYQAMNSKFNDQAATVTSQSHDLDTLRGQLTTTEADLAAAKRDAADTAAKLKQRAAELAEQRDAIEKWKAAVAQRDDLLKQTTGESKSLAAARDEAVRRYNALAGQINQQRQSASQ